MKSVANRNLQGVPLDSVARLHTIGANYKCARIY